MLESAMKELGIPPYKLKVEVDHENRIVELDFFLACSGALAEVLYLVIKEILKQEAHGHEAEELSEVMEELMKRFKEEKR